MKGEEIHVGSTQKAQSIVSEAENEAFVFSKEFDGLIKLTMGLAHSQCLEGEVITNDLKKAQVVLERAAKKFDRSIPGRAPDTELAVLHLFGLFFHAEDASRDPMLVCDCFHTLGFITAKLNRPRELSKLGKSGARIRYEPMRKLEAWALAEYRNGNWKAASKAAHAMKDAVIAHGRTIGAVLSESNAQRTIAEWINKEKRRSGS